MLLLLEQHFLPSFTIIIFLLLSRFLLQLFFTLTSYCFGNFVLSPLSHTFFT